MAIKNSCVPFRPQTIFKVRGNKSRLKPKMELIFNYFNIFSWYFYKLTNLIKVAFPFLKMSQYYKEFVRYEIN